MRDGEAKAGQPPKKGMDLKAVALEFCSLTHAEVVSPLLLCAKNGGLCLLAQSQEHGGDTGD